MALENASVLVNQTLDQAAPSASSSVGEYMTNNLLPRILDILVSPSENPDMLWTLAPMLIALVLMQLYFGRNKDEALGWNTAFGNSIALIFISVSLLRGVFISSGMTDISTFLYATLAFNDIRILIIALIFLYGIFLAMLSYFHWIPEKLAFFIMNGISINVTAYAGIVLVNSSNIPLDWTTLLGCVAIFIAVYLIAMLIRGFIPASSLSRIHLMERKRHMLHQKEKHYHYLAMKTDSDWKKRHMDAKALRYERKAEEMNSEIHKLKTHRLNQ
ncbi:hypothetical protein ACFL3V_02250 [Nanoarchaeota archaeon]